MTSVLLRVTGPDAFDRNPQAQPPHRELAQAEEGVAAGEGHTVIGADHPRQANHETSSITVLLNTTGVGVRTVQIDIKPGSFPNAINPLSNGRIPVAIRTTDAFDATTVNVTTVRFGRSGGEAAPVHRTLEDVDGDGDVDVLLQFRTQQTGIQCGDTSAKLTGAIAAGQQIQGADSIRTVGCVCPSTTVLTTEPSDTAQPTRFMNSVRVPRER